MSAPKPARDLREFAPNGVCSHAIGLQGRTRPAPRPKSRPRFRSAEAGETGGRSDFGSRNPESQVGAEAIERKPASPRQILPFVVGNRSRARQRLRKELDFALSRRERGRRAAFRPSLDSISQRRQRVRSAGFLLGAAGRCQASPEGLPRPRCLQGASLPAALATIAENATGWQKSSDGSALGYGGARSLSICLYPFELEDVST